MDPEFWHQRWRRGETGWHHHEINMHLREHWPRLEVAPGGRVFVPLCGKSLDLLWLAGEGYRVLGVELSPIAVDALFEENGLTPEILDEPPFRRYRADELEVLCGDFFALTPGQLGEVRAVYDRASLIALPPQRRPDYARHLQRLLDPRAPLLLITLDYPQEQMPGPPFSVAEDEVYALMGGRYRIRHHAAVDVLAENERFRQRGLTRLWEHVYELRAREA